MRAYVFQDAALAKQAGRFVWLSIDTEKERNLPFLERFPVSAWPTLMILDPPGEHALLRWPGSATVAQLGTLLDEGERALAGKDDDLTRAERLAGAGKNGEAAHLLEASLDRIPEGQRTRAVELLVVLLQLTGDAQKCADVAAAEGGAMVRGPSFANAVTSGLACAVAAPPGAPWRAAALARLEPLVEEALGLPGLLADDRSGIYETLVDLKKSQGDGARARELALAWLRFLEGEAAKARTPDARAAFDAHRVLAAQASGDPARAIAPLEASERDLPGDYNAPARLAQVYHQLKRYPAALAASDRALARVYGPRRVRVLEGRVEILAEMGDTTAAKRTCVEAIDLVEKEAPTPQKRRELERLRARLSTLTAPPR
jgi:tetratricopeptide (TPR) repeat protein